MGHDRVSDGAISHCSRICLEYLLSKSVRQPVGDSARVHEDALVCEGREQTAPVSDAERGV